MHEEDFAIIKALVPVAWADGSFADREKEMMDALLDAYNASEADKESVRAYAAEKRSLDDIELQDLSFDDRRVVLQHAVLMSFVDGEQHAIESAFLKELAARLRIPDEEATKIFDAGAERARKFMSLL